MISATEKDQHFWDRYADKYSRDKIADEESYRRKLEKTREYFSPASNVFEFGCGTGSTALLHAPYVAQIDATDLSPEMIGIAQRKASESGVNNVTFAQGELADALTGETAYDAVMGMSILHLLRNREDAIAHAHSLLKPGGVFITSTPCLSEMGIWRALLPVMRLIGKAPFVGVFSQSELAEDMISAGFKIVHQWQPKKGAAVFLVARKPDN